MRKFRKFECGSCGWRSSSFGHLHLVDPEKLPVAQRELQQHLDASPECATENSRALGNLRVKKLAVVFDEQN